MSFQFPIPAAVGEIYADPVTGLSYTWDGSMWKMGADSASAVAPYVLKAGDTMTGALLLQDPDPVVPLESTHKRYVDRLISELALYQGTWQVAANVPNLNIPPNAPLNGYSWTAQTADPNVPEMAPLTIPGIGGRMIAALDTIKFSSALNPPTGAYEHIQGPVSISQMVIADTPPAGAFHGQGWWDSDSGKQYVYYIDASGSPGAWVQMSGGGGSALPEAPDDGAMYGRQALTAGTPPVWAAIVTSATIIGDVAPATPGDGQLWWNTTDGTLNIWDLANTAWVQTNVEEAPVDGSMYARKDAGWVTTTTTLTGDAPADGRFYARKDAAWQLSPFDQYLPLTGGTVTGRLSMHINGNRAIQFGISGRDDWDFYTSSTDFVLNASGVNYIWKANKAALTLDFFRRPTIGGTPIVLMTEHQTALDRIAALEARLAKAKL